MGRTSATSIAALALSFLVCSLGLAQVTMQGTANQIDRSSGRTVERLPIEGLLKVVTESGEVMFMSLDRRFVFRGKMTDLWEGEAIGIPSVGQTLNFERNGVSADRISFAVGNGPDTYTVFVAPECLGCKQMIRQLLDADTLDERTYQFVLLSTTQQGEHNNRLVWCSEDRAAALEEIYLKGITPKSLRKVGSECDQFGLFLARQAAQVFGIARLPMVASSDGEAAAGYEAAMKHLGFEGEVQ